jgi:hypothetical protein
MSVEGMNWLDCYGDPEARFANAWRSERDLWGQLGRSPQEDTQETTPLPAATEAATRQEHPVSCACEIGAAAIDGTAPSVVM